MSIRPCVSLYSLQYQYLLGKMSLDDIFRFVKSTGAEGIEILPDQMIKGAPIPDEKTLAEWDNIVKKYDLNLVCDDVFLNTDLYINRTLTKRECINLIKQEITLAHRLGFNIIRLVSMVPYWVLEPCLEMAEKYNIVLALEIHAGLGFGMHQTDGFLNEMLRLDSPYIGIIPDAGLFCRKPPRVVAEYHKKLYDTNSEIIKYAEDVFASGTDFFALKIKNGGRMDLKLESLIKDEKKDRSYAEMIESYENLDLSCLDPFDKYIKHFHFKLYEITEEGVEYSINYKELLDYLKLHGYNGYVSTEYEGNRWVLPGLEIPDKEQVMAHQKLIQKLLKEMGE